MATAVAYLVASGESGRLPGRMENLLVLLWFCWTLLGQGTPGTRPGSEAQGDQEPFFPHLGDSTRTSKDQDQDQDQVWGSGEARVSTGSRDLLDRHNACFSKPT